MNEESYCVDNCPSMFVFQRQNVRCFPGVLRITTSSPEFYRTLPSDMKDPRSGMKLCWLGPQWSPCCFVLCAMHCFVSYITPMKAVFPILAYFSYQALVCIRSPMVPMCFVLCIMHSFLWYTTPMKAVFPILSLVEFWATHVDRKLHS